MSDKIRIPSTIIVLGVVSLLTDAATEMIYPLLPLFISAVGSGVVILGIIEGVAETTAALVKLYSGILSDRLGRRKLLVLVGYSISSLIRPFTGLVSAGWQIVAIRMLDRVGKGIRTAPRDAMIADTADARIRGRAYGFHRAMDHTGAIIGPILALCTIGILVLGFDIGETPLLLRWTFGAAILPGIGAVAVLLFFLKEPAGQQPGFKGTDFSFRHLSGNFKKYLVILTLFTLGNSSDAFLLFRVAESTHASSALRNMFLHNPVVNSVISRVPDEPSHVRIIDILFLPIVWAFFHLIKALFSTPLGSLSDRIGRKRSITIGWGIYAFVYGSFALLDRIPGEWEIAATFTLFAVYATYYAFTEGAEKAFVAELVGKEYRGSAFGMFNFAIGLGALPASILFGFLYGTFGATLAFGLGSSLALVSMLSLALFVDESPDGQHATSLAE